MSDVYPVVVNAAAGSVDGDGRQRRALEDAFEQVGATAEVHLVEPEVLARTVADLAAGHEVVVVAGGDGTLGTAARAVSEAGATLGIVPLGTFNHFAKDLGIAVDDLAAAAAAVVSGDTIAVDLAEVNGRPFVNNSSIGVYPAMVDLRDEIRSTRGWGKVRAVPVASWRVLRRFPVRRLHIRAGEIDELVRTPFVFVGNNRYEVGGRGMGSRPSLQDGTLSLHLAKATSRFGLVLSAAATLLRGSEAERGLDATDAAEVTVGAHGHRILIAVDGEITTMRTPLRYRVLPGALRVRVPSSTEPPPGDGARA